MPRIQEICDMLEAFCPMHVVLDKTGHIKHAGPTLRKLMPDETVVGKRFLEVFELMRPRSVNTMAQLREVSGQRLRVRKRCAPQTILKGGLVNIETEEVSVINLSFGFSVMEGVRDYALTSADFAATDLTIEMLYLIEAKSAAMEASRKLNQRLQGAMIAAEEQAFTDTLTGLKNRRALDMILGRWLESGRPLVVAQMDLDYFKRVNDTFGHAAGDHVLQTVARILVEETREGDCVARTGGDEFVLLLSGALSDKKLAGFANRVISRIEKPIPFNADECKISTSLGFAPSETTAGLSAETLLVQADTALYDAKRRGRAQHRVYTPEMDLAVPPEKGDAPVAEQSDPPN
ncbi:GGDEF domain-containing protein [Rhodobacteraceae bacterium 4F10]|nr:GGDEF domain-containing protein [Rhodobacteraceae bacterium 4F10]